ncbi:hypothetical protein [Fluoribacter gormanii]|uniref:Uncharacterized protein n=1 Tax=Fluoribacter gormanii TaxID=464 RepID=A0A377GJ83_9GAMM|nr:hypothetical protein [Fluoribacter gormanii]KTD01359.1 hypothetical protein Lgor_2425 [Fluoribacter gormanii]SIR48291.1 hypothetical protein SAMN05421777_11351 [Fluoribacter gormanii]STO24841.1 Uncharacterised protein [Fluoribacter gormanii]
MTINTLWNLFIIICFFTYHLTGFTASNSIQFFYSNNNQILDLENAYQRLIGKEQHELKRIAIHVLQKQHLDLGEFKNALGTYTMHEEQQFTAENSEIFYVSPLQKLSRKRTFLIASILAKQLKQESVAVFIPNHTNAIGHIKLVFNYNKLTITDLIPLTHKLPVSFNHAFTINLRKTHSGFESAEVHSIEWIGSNLNSSVIRNLFPFDKVLSYSGEAYLVFNNGIYQKL